MNQSLRIGGFIPLSTVDYPGALAAVIFCQGCAWRCRYCHNPELLPSIGAEEIAWLDIINFLKKRQGLLDAVVFSGGEPILQNNLRDAIEQVIELGYNVGLHTAGSKPERLNKLLPLINWVGLDIKAHSELHHTVTGVPGSGTVSWKSAHLIINSSIDYEIRITIHPDLITPEHFERILQQLKQMGAKRVVVQNCQMKTVLDTTLSTAYFDKNRYQSILNTTNFESYKFL